MGSRNIVLMSYLQGRKGDAEVENGLVAQAGEEESGTNG